VRHRLLQVRFQYHKRALGYWLIAQQAYLTGAAPTTYKCGWCGRVFKPKPYQTVKYLRHKYQPNECPKCR
jgi:DNA-directed RNA polymerase subunit RPC12/RpoP